ncbi:MAG: hypothetical protein MH204_08915 [Fimbriimonadaceae bacterium]|nr:hypothetical protein [Fimbriimonadaceae bacterium]
MSRLKKCCILVLLVLSAGAWGQSLGFDPFEIDCASRVAEIYGEAAGVSGAFAWGGVLFAVAAMLFSVHALWRMPKDHRFRPAAIVFGLSMLLLGAVSGALSWRNSIRHAAESSQSGRLCSSGSFETAEYRLETTRLSLESLEQSREAVRSEGLSLAAVLGVYLAAMSLVIVFSVRRKAPEHRTGAVALLIAQTAFLPALSGAYWSEKAIVSDQMYDAAEAHLTADIQTLSAEVETSHKQP